MTDNKTVVFSNVNELVEDMQQCKVLTYANAVKSSIPVEDFVKEINPNADFTVAIHNQQQFNTVESDGVTLQLSFILDDMTLSRMALWNPIKSCSRTQEGNSTYRYIIELEDCTEIISLLGLR